MKKTYKIEHWNTNAEIYIEVDSNFKIIEHSISQEKAIKEMVEYWSGWERRLRLNNNDYLLTIIKQIAEWSFIKGLENDWNIKGIKDYWSNWNEGYYPLAEIGINIENWVCPEIDWEDEITVDDVTDLVNAT